MFYGLKGCYCKMSGGSQKFKLKMWNTNRFDVPECKSWIIFFNCLRLISTIMWMNFIWLYIFSHNILSTLTFCEYTNRVHIYIHIRLVKLSHTKRCGFKVILLVEAMRRTCSSRFIGQNKNHSHRKCMQYETKTDFQMGGVYRRMY